MRAGIGVSARQTHLVDAKGGWGENPAGFHAVVSRFSKARARCSSRHEMPPSRQERRKAERDAAKHAPRVGGTGAAGAAAALANLNVNAGGDWTTQAEHPYVGPGPVDFALQATSYDVM